MAAKNKKRISVFKQSDILAERLKERREEQLRNATNTLTADTASDPVAQRILYKAISSTIMGGGGTI